MDAAEVRLNGPLSIMPLADCSLPTLKLYRSSSYGGSVLQLTARLVVINLASYGFDNDTSSYKIGACSAGFYDTTGGATQYPGNTGANVTSPSMLSGWDNRVGSVYMLGVMGGMVVGAAIAGPLANQWGITAPFWFAFVGSALILVAIWQALGHIAHADAEALQH